MREGDLITLKCSSLGGFPVPTIKWTKSVLKSVHKRSTDHDRGHKITDHHGLSNYNHAFQGHDVNQNIYDEKEISGLDTRTGHSGISSEVLIKITPSDNRAIYKCLVFNEAISIPKVTSVTIEQVTFMSEKLTSSSDKINAYADSSRAPTDYTEVTCSSGECNPACNITWSLGGQLIIPLDHGAGHNQFNNLLIGSTTNFHFKINTSYNEGLYGSSLTFSKLIISNRRKSWTSNDDKIKLTCTTFNGNQKEIKKNVTVNVLCMFCNLFS